MARNAITVTIAIPTAGMVPMDLTYSLVGLISNLSHRGIPTRRECSFNFRMDVVKSPSIHGNREKLVTRAIEHGDTHILFIDDDMCFEPRALEIMFGRRAPVVVTNYLIKVPDPRFVAIGLGGEFVPTTEASVGAEPILFSGFGFSLFDLDVFKGLPKPWFMPEWDEEKQDYTTEDYPFFQKLHAAGHEVLLDHDASKLLGHVGRKVWGWQEWTPDNVVQLPQETRDGKLENAG